LGFIYEEDMCFVCGSKSTEGLKIKFEHIQGGKSEARYAFEPRHQGYDGVVHGGILAAVLDDSMAHAVMALGLMPITTEMRIRFKKPIAVGEEVLFEGQVEKVGRRMVEAKAVGIGPDGEVKVEAEGKFLIGKAENKL
jgi:uncharacterized protein (TIGR00369 family)